MKGLLPLARFLVVITFSVSFSDPAMGSQNERSTDAVESPELMLVAESKSGAYNVAVWPQDGNLAVGKMHRWLLQILSTNGEPVYPAKVSIGGGMEAHKHGLPTQPQLIAYGGDGVYLVDGVRFNMAGEWRLSFVIESEHGVDQVDFDIDVQF